MTTQLNKADAKNNALTAALNTERDSAAKLAYRVREVEQTVSRQEGMIEILRQEKDRLSLKVAEYDGRLTAQSARIDALNDELERAQDENRRLSEKNEALKALNARLTTENAELKIENHTHERMWHIVGVRLQDEKAKADDAPEIASTGEQPNDDTSAQAQKEEPHG